MKKKLSILLVVMMLFPVFAACRNRNKINKNMTQLYISVYSGGVGTDWLDQAKIDFEAAQADVSYEEGKRGVQIFIDPNMSDLGIINTIAGSPNEVYFADAVRYTDFVSQGLLLDISDVVEAELSDGTVIEEKLGDAQKASLKVVDGKYYALPHYETYQGVIYDKDLFEAKKLYFAEDRSSYDFILESNQQRSVGPDGVANTSDDGLPATIEELFALLNHMHNTRVRPFVWTGQHPQYTNFLMNAIYANYQGKDEVFYNYSFNSGDDTTDIITGFDNNGNPIHQDVKITDRNGYLLRQQAGKYYALKALSDIMSNPNYYEPKSLGDGTYSHHDAQEDFILSSLENKPIGMIIEGTWWENEARISGAVERSYTYGEKAKNRNFGWMPMPGRIKGIAQEGKGTRNIVIDDNSSYAMINGNIKDKPHKVKLAKDFIKFLYTDKQLANFTAITGSAKGLKYELGDKYDQLTPFAKDVWDMRQRSDVVYPHGTSKLFINNESGLASAKWSGTVNSQSYTGPVNAFKTGISAKDYFLGMWITQDNWNTVYSKDFE